jgi:hypothetical protein
LIVLLAAGAGGLFGQSVVGRVSGTVTDASGGIIPNATVTITNEATKVDRVVTADENGFYVATALPLGSYTVAVEMAGFKKAAISGNVLVADGRLTVNLKLEVGQITSTVEVVAAGGEAVNTVSGEVQRVAKSTSSRRISRPSSAATPAPQSISSPVAAKTDSTAACSSSSGTTSWTRAISSRPSRVPFALTTTAGTWAARSSAASFFSS